MIAALYVQSNGVYFGLPNVDPWDEQRDARLYQGPHPVVAHPPCARWSRLAAVVERLHGIPRHRDGGVFAAALAAVREFGGVLEHPKASAAWKHHGLIVPPGDGGWVVADDRGGWTCCVDQGRYGHPAQKSTWLYANKVPLPSLRWGAVARDDPRGGWVQQKMNSRSRRKTPIPFRDLLISMAEAAR